MDLDLNPEQQVFRDDIRSYLERAMTPEIHRATELNVAALFDYSVSHPWHLVLAEKGWAAPEWPERYGGAGWDAVQLFLWRMETWRAGAPVISQLGMRLVSPVLLEFGTEEQKQRFLPSILSGTEYWCQGFSEPNAGSDLAALQCAGVRVGDEYVVNGTKLWQTHAHDADWMILLVRTDGSGKPQEGITCLLVDMRSPGIDIKPIITIGGDHETNQIFLDDVRVPVINRIGEENQGWGIAKHLLSIERAGSGNASARLRSALRWIEGLVDHCIGDAACLNEDSVLRERLARCAIDVDTIEMMDLQQLLAKEGYDLGTAASIIKLRSSIVEQQIAELAIDLVGERALRWIDHRPLHEVDEEMAHLRELAVAPKYLNSRIRTIFGGASEVQLGIIAKSLE